MHVFSAVLHKTSPKIAHFAQNEAKLTIRKERPEKDIVSASRGGSRTAPTLCGAGVSPAVARRRHAGANPSQFSPRVIFSSPLSWEEVRCVHNLQGLIHA